MKWLLYFAAAALLLGGAAASDVAGSTHLAVGPRSALYLNGTSNVAAWRCTGRTVQGVMTVAAPISKINEVIDRVEDGNIAAWMSNPSAGHFPQPELALTIPINTLRCTGGRPMERDMNRALKAEQFPTIAFRFDGLRSGVNHDLDRREYRATVAGQLSLAGVERSISFETAVQRTSRTQFRMTAEMPVRMSEFGIAPPTALFGMIKSADALSVRFDLVLVVAP
ncbi:MAG: YceI family protein [Thermoanaerobaculia bacterium]